MSDSRVITIACAIASAFAFLVSPIVKKRMFSFDVTSAGVSMAASEPMAATELKLATCSNGPLLNWTLAQVDTCHDEADDQGNDERNDFDDDHTTTAAMTMTILPAYLATYSHIA